MNMIETIKRRSEQELALGIGMEASWHNEFRDSAVVYVGGLAYAMTEGDVLAVFSQYGEIEDIQLVRDRETGKSKGFAFLKYEDQRSTILAVDNLNGFDLLGRRLRVDHVKQYRREKLGRDADADEQQRFHQQQQEKEQALATGLGARPTPANREREQRERQQDEEEDAFLQFRKQKRQHAPRPAEEQDREAIARRLGLDPEDPMYDYAIDRELGRQASTLKRRHHRRRRSRSRSRSRSPSAPERAHGRT